MTHESLWLGEFRVLPRDCISATKHFPDLELAQETKLLASYEPRISTKLSLAVKPLPVTRTSCGFPVSLAESWSRTDGAFHLCAVSWFMSLGSSTFVIPFLVLSERSVVMHNRNQFSYGPSSHLGILHIAALPT